MASFTSTSSARCPPTLVSRQHLNLRTATGVPAGGARFSRVAVRAADKAVVLSKVQEIVQEQLGNDEPPAASAKFVDMGADSLDTVEIMMALEEEFEVELEESEAEKISTVDDAATMIAAQMDSK